MTITVVDQTGKHVYQPGFMYIAMGGERAGTSSDRSAACSTLASTLVVGEVEQVDEDGTDGPSG